MDSGLLIVVCNVPDEAVANRLTEALLQRQLVACVNQLPSVQSTYRWQGQIEQAQEIPLLLKTTAQNFPALCQAIQSEHPYQVPEIIAVPISHALSAYADWVKQECDVEH